jgi:hypothetical protein
MRVPLLEDARAGSENLRAARFSAQDARDVVVLGVAGLYLQAISGQAQIAAARRLHGRLTIWTATDRAFQQLREGLPGWDLEACILKAAAVNHLYSTNVFAIGRMAEHLMGVMQKPPDDPVALVEAIASLPDAEGKAVERKHWSFASKLCHFFVCGARFPIYDSYCRAGVARHLGRGGYAEDAGNPYTAFV